MHSYLTPPVEVLTCKINSEDAISKYKNLLGKIEPNKLKRDIHILVVFYRHYYYVNEVGWIRNLK
ncbi:hypothetical protein GCM10008935_17870 [Alkalibacillus silvisoli]|uniref:Uncharacterized protein n=1 Tax=Alkalibacillus silvisoli TaxID=392823 RepID=A0ABN0ZZ11_9BACI